MVKYLSVAVLFVAVCAADAGIFRNRCAGRGGGFFQRERHTFVQRGSGCAACDAMPAAPSSTLPRKASADLPGMLYAVNAERARFGLPPLELCPNMSAQVQGHIERRGFVHSGLPYRENIARGQGSGEEAVGDWMRSSGHRANILTNGATKAGVGEYGNVFILAVQ